MATAPVTAVRIKPARTGPDYSIHRRGPTVVLSRPGRTGQPNSVSMTGADVINVCNALIDALEQLPEKDKQS